jgi:hypothetical protein
MLLPARFLPIGPVAPGLSSNDPPCPHCDARTEDWSGTYIFCRSTSKNWVPVPCDPGPEGAGYSRVGKPLPPPCPAPSPIPK